MFFDDRKKARISAVAHILKNFPRVEKKIWIAKNEVMGYEALESQDLSPRERITAKLAAALWMGHIVISVTELIDLDEEVYKAFKEAIEIARGA